MVTYPLRKDDSNLSFHCDVSNVKECQITDEN